jgi:hypothetical protein
MADLHSHGLLPIWTVLLPFKGHPRVGGDLKPVEMVEPLTGSAAKRTVNRILSPLRDRRQTECQ